MYARGELVGRDGWVSHPHLGARFRSRTVWTCQVAPKGTKPHQGTVRASIRSQAGGNGRGRPGAASDDQPREQHDANVSRHGLR